MRSRFALVMALVVVATGVAWIFLSRVPPVLPLPVTREPVKVTQTPNTGDREPAADRSTSARSNPLPPRTNITPAPGSTASQKMPTPAARTVYMPPEPAPKEGEEEIRGAQRMFSDYRQIM